MNHDLPTVPQPGLDLPGPPALLQPQAKQVVVATESDQDPLPHVEPVAGEPQGVGAVPEVGTDSEVTLCELNGRGRNENPRTTVNTNVCPQSSVCDWPTSRTMYSPASWDVTDSRVPEAALVRSSSWMLVRRELPPPPPLSWKRTALPESKENSGTADGEEETESFTSASFSFLMKSLRGQYKFTSATAG